MINQKEIAVLETKDEMFAAEFRTILMQFHYPFMMCGGKVKRIVVYERNEDIDEEDHENL